MPVKYVLQLFVPLVDPVTGAADEFVAGDFDDTDSEFLTAQTAYGVLSFPRVSCHALKISTDIDFPTYIAQCPSVKVIN